MKLTDRTDLSPETIALYQRLEAERYPGFNPKNPAHWLLGVAVWPAVLMRWPLRSGLALAGLVALIGIDAAHRYPAPAPLPMAAESHVNMPELMKSLVGCPAGTHYVSGSHRASSHCRRY